MLAVCSVASISYAVNTKRARKPMKKVSIDLTVDASAEAKICLSCERPRCIPHNCVRYKQMKDKLKQEKLHRIENFESEAISQK